MSSVVWSAEFNYQALLLRFMTLSHLFNQPVAEDAEQEHLPQGISQIPDDTQSEDTYALDFGRLISQECQHNGWC